MAKRSFHFFRLEDRILLSGEGNEAMEAIVPDPGVMEMLQAEIDAMEAAAATVGSIAGEATPPQDEASESSEPTEQSDLPDVSQLDATKPIEIIFVDAGVEGADTLIANVRDSNADTQWLIVKLEAEQNGIDQITQTLASMSGVDAIHLLSHGDGAGVVLGNTKLTVDSAPSYAGDIAAWGHALDAQANLLIYGCDLARTTEGQDLIEMLAIV
ncbi:DUF4347 domain-containing protein, partial [Neorhodopirellula pilleata]|uniref:DUF4347 domain-containing protein n=1 Tax=Neorhodopirellula pilleata TaxID=2714738 RepID=UPI0011B74060